MRRDHIINIAYVLFPFIIILLIWHFFSLINNVLGELNDNDLKTKLDESLGYLQLLLSLLAPILSTLVVRMVSINLQISQNIAQISSNTSVSSGQIDQNTTALTKNNTTLENNINVINENEKVIKDTHDIINDFPHISSLILSKHKVSTLNRNGIIAVLSTPIGAPIIDYMYQDCIGVIDIIMPDTFHFQDLLLCNVYMKYLITRARSVLKEGEQNRLIIIDEENLLLDDGTPIPIFVSYLQITEALGYKNYLVDKKTYVEIINAIQKNHDISGYTKEVTAALLMQPSITFGLKQKIQDNKKIYEYNTRCDFQDLDTKGQPIDELQSEKAKKVALFLGGFLVKGLGNELRSNNLHLRRTYKSINSNNKKIKREIIHLNRKYTP